MTVAMDPFVGVCIVACADCARQTRAKWPSRPHVQHCCPHAGPSRRKLPSELPQPEQLNLEEEELAEYVPVVLH